MVDPVCAGLQVYAVGGWVRDRLLGLPAADRDWVVIGSCAEEMLARGFIPVTAPFPVFLHPHTREEYALARRERKSGTGYLGFVPVFTPETTLEEDLARRDLTINTMAMGDDGSLVDPFGGVEDLQQRWLRHVSPAFAEDPLRVLRVARFYAVLAPYGFRVASETLVLLRALVESGEISSLTPERVWRETEKALGAVRPSLYFQLLHQCGALAVLFPELAALIGQHQPAQYHPEGDAWCHTLEVLDRAAQLSGDPVVRFAALLHDVGKGTTPAALLPHHYGHEERGPMLVDALSMRLRVPGRYRNLARLTARWHLLYHQADELRPGRLVRLLTDLKAWHDAQGFERFLLACRADRDEQRRGTSTNPEQRLRTALQVCRDVDTAGLQQRGYVGKQFGEAVRELRTRAVMAMDQRL
jgi:tRNA nucleotidyltransferase (CCA-adding enzyme)